MEITGCGLPRRSPGQRGVPAVELVVAPGVLRRDPEAVRRRTSGFQRGRTTALYRPASVRQMAPDLRQSSGAKEMLR